MSRLFEMARRFLTNSGIRFDYLEMLGLYNCMKDEFFLRNKFKAYMGYNLNLNNPQTFNEKLQWLKLYDRKPEYNMMVDKYLVRKYIKEKLGEEYLIPLIGVWDSPDLIDFDALPDQFVLKCNHNSGLGMCVCKDKSKLDVEKAMLELKKGFAQNYYLSGREWPYKNVQRKIICEKFMSNQNDEVLKDYKIQCFNGEVDHIFVCVDRDEQQRVCKYYYFDKNWKYLPYSWNDRCDDEFLASLKPKTFEEMIAIAENLSAGIPEVRVDLYEIQGRVYFGELTFFTQSGFDTTITSEADREIGSRLVLPFE